ncbi:MAG: hypothetical protein RLZZ543_1978 [Bacteroidota bacterium]|jgi:hypothetical protein
MGLIKRIHFLSIQLMLLLLLSFNGSAQTLHAPMYSVHDDKMLITLSLPVDTILLDTLIRKFDLNALSLKESLKSDNWSNARLSGWDMRRNRKQIILSKHISETMKLDELFMLNAFTQELNAGEPGVPVMKGNFGVNRFKDRDWQPRMINDSIAEFFLKGFENAQSVFLAGSFNGWSTSGQAMHKIENGWSVLSKVKAGKHLYKFIVDGKWMNDPNASENEYDGYGGSNSVFYASNYVFRLKNMDAKRVILAGNFNDWNEQELKMNKKGNDWELPVYLEQGTYTYKFIADGNWLSDPLNAQKVPDGNGGFNSVIRLGNPHVFKLKGFERAHTVLVAGDFNDWKPDELYMAKTDSGWVLPYVLKPGNYGYKFIVDDQWIVDPANPHVQDDGNGNTNSLLVFAANHTFFLKGNLEKKDVVVAGDFNDWNPSQAKMKRGTDGWYYSVYLSPGKHHYKFVVDGTWITDPENPLWEENEHRTNNSIFWKTP